MGSTDVWLLLLPVMPAAAVPAAIQRNLVLRFKDDTIDDSLELTQLLQNRWARRQVWWAGRHVWWCMLCQLL